MDYETLRKQVSEFRDERDWQQFHTPENLAKSISIEAGELLECFQWDGENFDMHAAEEELSDVFIYCLHMASAMHVDLLEIAADKMKQNAEKYPVDKARGKSTKYDRL